MSKPRIVIVGGGAGGLELAAKLGRKLGRKNRADVVLIDRNSTHIWKPLLHEVASGSLDAAYNETGYATHAYRNGYTFLQGELRNLDRTERVISLAPVTDTKGRELTDELEIDYDYLVIAVGSTVNDFGTEGVSDYCHYLDTRENAELFRRQLIAQGQRILRERAVHPETDSELKVAIVGAGATGAELSAELMNTANDLKSYGLENFRERHMKVTLIEAGDKILPQLSGGAREEGVKELENLGIRLMTETKITAAHAGGFDTDAGETIPADILVWAAGVKADPFLQSLDDLECTNSNQLIVNTSLQTSRDARIYAIGDCAACVDINDVRIPARAQAAHQMGTLVAENIERVIDGKPVKSFEYQDHGSLVSTRRDAAVGSLGKGMQIKGRAARLAYNSLYRMHQISVHGLFRGSFLIVQSWLHNIGRPRLKLH